MTYQFDGAPSDDSLNYLGDDSLLAYGYGGNDYFWGNNNNDTLDGGDGNDTLKGWYGNDVLLGGNGNDFLEGEDDDDTLFGEAGNDTLDGGTGNDSMYGVTGDDTYYVDAYDTVIEYANQGIDTVYASVGYTLPDNVENLTLSGLDTNFSWESRGNSLDNVIRNESDAQVALSGLAGNDTIYGGTNLWNSLNLLFGGTGNDIIYDGIGNNALSGEEGNDSLYGNDGNDTVDGGNGNDFLNGDNGNDELYGGAGRDTINGQYGNDILYGEDGNDTMHAGEGNDTLIGGAGSDYVIGAGGADQFTFYSPTQGIDRISDFNGGLGDQIVVSASGFGGGLAIGSLPSSLFYIGSTAHDADDRLIYNSSNGQLFFDADGTGTQFGQIHFATLSSNPTLSSSNISVIA